jgi:predicted metal-dependent HD superfamily phosphohydrolase
MSQVTPERWCALMRAFGVADHLAMFDRVHAAYREPHRFYHDVSHIDACLGQFARSHSLARSSAEVEMALWLHDVVYAPRASDNEVRSARWAVDFLRSAGVPEARASLVEAHIMATVHAAEPHDPDSRLVVDIDLSILGRDETMYDAFERNVRQEYQWVPWLVYRRKRIEVLGTFLERPRIYFTESFRESYESPARANLARAIAMLST